MTTEEVTEQVRRILDGHSYEDPEDCPDVCFCTTTQTPVSFVLGIASCRDFLVTITPIPETKPV